jgi:hypothetical protein
MGRPPKGSKAMTAAERQAERRKAQKLSTARKKAIAKGEGKFSPPFSPSHVLRKEAVVKLDAKEVMPHTADSQGSTGPEKDKTLPGGRKVAPPGSLLKKV